MLRPRYLPLLLLLLSCGQRHTLFQDGQSDYKIVIAADAPETEQYAAQELQTWLREVSGAELPIVADALQGKRLVVGFGPLVEAAVPGAEKPADGDDAFTWCSRDGDIYLWGGSKRGTLYAVYSFLEEELGCRWYSSQVSVAPRKERWRFGKLDHHEEPGILIRDNCVLDVRSNPVFSARMRNNFIKVPSRMPGQTVEGSAEGYWGVHALGYHVPSQKYYSTHPEYFSLRDGERLSGYAQLCLSNPEVLAITIESLREVMRREPDYLIYSVEQNDNQLYCQCPECEKLAQQYGGQSGVMIWFVNQVADAVREEFPDKFVGTFAYQYTRHAPKDIVPRENVVVRLCSIECCMLHTYDDCERNTPFLQDLKDWSAIAPHLYIWDYVTDFSQYCLPVANWKTLQPHVQDFRDNHAIGILEEGDYQTVSCELKELRSWLLSKLLWNPDAPMKALIRDFTDGYYGAGGPYVRKYLDLEDRILLRPGIHAPCYIAASDPMYTDEYLREGRELFAKARKAVGADSVLVHRLETAEFPLCFLEMANNPLQGMTDGAEALIRRVIARDGITLMCEGEWGGGVRFASRLLERYDALKRSLEEAPLLPARPAQPVRKGVAYTRYEGDFLTTDEMLASGRITGKGTLKTIEIEADGALDHFGYVFDTWLEARETGLHQIRLTTDDGSVLLVDGKEVIVLDGSHAPESTWAFLNLEKGFHHLVLRYFEDCEEQVLTIGLHTPDGYDGPLPEDRLFLIGDHQPFPWDEPHPERSMLSRWAQKEVLDACLVDDMEQEGRWTVREGKPELSYTRENCKDGVRALRQTVSLVDWEHIQDPSQRTPWGSFGGEQGGWTCVALEFPKPQDWSKWNRISLWAYIHPSRNPNVSFALDLVTTTKDGTLTHGRETNVDIPQGRWVQVLWEIDDLPRSEVLRFELCQTCTGYDRAIGEPTVTIDFDRLELQKVLPDHYEGWDLPAGAFSYAHTGYRPQDVKRALAGPGAATRFSLENEEGKQVFEGDSRFVTGRGGTYQELDFSAFNRPGTYRIRYGDTVSEPFPIGPDVWKEPVWGALNFYYSQRCGYPVSGIHDVCHADAQGFLDDRTICVNGGWHDAGDLSQGFWRTAYATYALLQMQEVLSADAELSGLLAREARWGVDWLLKVRFPEGRHISWSTLRYYSDNIIGTPDDVLSQAVFIPWETFLGAAVLVKAGEADAAREDWEAAMEGRNPEAPCSYLEAAWGAVASSALFERFGEERYREAALAFGRELLRCQELKGIPGIPVLGYFYTDTRRRQLLHDHHAAFNEAPMLAYAALCRTFPDASAPFREGARVYLGGYLKLESRLSAPYHLLPAGVFPQDGSYVVRTFPVWTDHVFHGATHFHLSQAWALAAAAQLLEDREALTLVQAQLEWVMGRNPFSSSLMYGVGYNYAPLFAYCTHNVTGALPVGVDSFRDDQPFWNGSAHATSHEMWVEPVSRFLGTLAVFLQAQN